MKPADITLLRVPGRPALSPQGEVVVAISAPDLDKNSYQGALHRLSLGAEGPAPGLVPFTQGEKDSAPVLSPDGSTVVFLRAIGDGRPQLYSMPLHGGEPRRLTDHPLGAGTAVFSPDGSRIAYLAAVPEPGRYGTDETVTAEAEPPRRVARHRYRLDDKGFILDKPEQVFVLDVSAATAGGGAAAGTAGTAPLPGTAGTAALPGTAGTAPLPGTAGTAPLPGTPGTAPLPGAPVQLTAEPAGAESPVFTGDGREVAYVREVGEGRIDSEIVAALIPWPVPGRAQATIQGPAQGAQGNGSVPPPMAPRDARLLVRPGGSVEQLTAAGDILLFCSATFDGYDFAGRNTGLWSVPVVGGEPTRLTDEATVDVDTSAGPPVVIGQGALVAVLDRGAVSLRRVPLAGRQLILPALATVIGGDRAVKAFTAQADWLLAVVADPSSPGELVALPVGASVGASGVTSAGASGVASGVTAGPEVRLTDLAAGLRIVGTARPAEITGTSRDGYPVHGWLVLPEGEGPHPVLLALHGGPHTAYNWGLFDEAQVYAGAGYAVVLPNPRGSAGYGQDHGRSIIGRLGTIDADDVLALLDAAVESPACDDTRVGVMGGSYGGFMTSWLAAHSPERFVAGISERAVNAWDSFAGSSDIGYFFVEAYVGAGRDEQWAASPLSTADRIEMPMLIIHSEQDWRCPIEQAQRLFVALKNRGAVAEMLIFPGEGHELSRSGRPRHRLARFDAILKWWDSHLPVGGGAAPAGSA